MTLPSASAVACDFPGNLGLLSLKYTKRLSRSHMEYSVVHSGDLCVLLTPSSFGKLQDSLTVTPTVSPTSADLDSLTMSWCLYLWILCAATPSVTVLGPVSIIVSVTCQPENKRLFKICLVFHGEERVVEGWDATDKLTRRFERWQCGMQVFVTVIFVHAAL